MPVVINEFEVITEPAPQPAEPQAASEPPQPAVTPADINQAVQQHTARMERIWAH